MHCHMQDENIFPLISSTNFNRMYSTDRNLSGRKVVFSFETNKSTLTFNNDRRKVDRSNHDVYPPCRVFVVIQMETVVRRFVQEKPCLFCKSILFDESDD